MGGQIQVIPITKPARDSLIAVSILWICGIAVVSLRCLSRIRARNFGIDDVLSIAATVLAGSSIGMSAAVFAAGVGYDFDEKSPVFPALASNLGIILEITFAFTIVYIWALAALKLSQLFLYLRTFELQLRNWIWFGIAMVLMWGISFTFVFIFLCDPIKQQWTLQRIGKCLDQILVLKSLIMTNVLTDLFIVILPLRTIWTLQMRTTEKLVVSMCFAMGLACCVIGIVRFIFMFEIDLLGNLTGTSLSTFILLPVELLLAVLCINIPTLRPYYMRFRSQHGSFWGRSNKSGEDSYAMKNDSRNDGLVTIGGTGAEENAAKDARRGGARGDYNAWIELNDHDNERLSDGDTGSERKLTRAEQSGGSGGNKGIHVSTQWAVTKT